MTEQEHRELRELYNPEGSDLRKAQLRMLDMLSFVNKVCKTENISYWIDGGTLLGAMRHKGFIPWDDDMDICMPLEDYKRFKKHMLSHEDSNFVLQCHESDPNYYQTWGVMRDLKYKLSDGSKPLENYKYQGVQMDIFPIDDRRNKKLWRILCFFFRWFVVNPLFEGRITHLFRWIVAPSFFFLTKVLIPCFRFITPHDKEHLSHAYGDFWFWGWKKKDVYPLGEIEFEGRTFACPHNPDEYLKHLYGDWTQVPSKDKIHTHNFTFEIIDHRL